MELTLDQALKKGIEAHKSGKVQEADRYYTAILKENPKHPYANHNMGVLATGVGKVETALPFFKVAIDANPSIAQFWLSYIDALIKLDRKADAKVVLKQAKSKGSRKDAFDKIEKRLQEPGTTDATSEKLQERAKGELQSLVNLYLQGQHQQALTQGSKLRGKFPGSVTLYKILAASNQRLGNLNEAIEAYKKVITIEPAYAEGHNNLGIALHEKSRLGEAIEAYNKAVSIKPDYADAYYSMGNALQEQGKLEEAIKAYTKAISIAPDFAEAYSNLGAALNNQGKLEKATEAFKKAVSIKPDYSDAYNNMGNALIEQGKLEAALKAYNMAVSIKPDYAEAHYNMGNALKEQNKLERAIEAYNKAIEAFKIANFIKPDYPDAYNNKGNALKEQGKLDAALEAYNMALSIKPDYAEAYSNIGAALQEKGKLDLAIEAYNKALSIKPDYVETYSNMGVALQKQGNLDEAIDTHKKALAIKPDYADAYYNMGNALKEQGKLDEAIEAHNKALSIKPDYAAAYSNMGITLQDQGKLEEAIEAYTNALSIKPDFAEVILNASTLRNQLGDTVLITEDFKKRLKSHSPELIEMPTFQIQQAIRAFLLSNQELVRQHLNSYNGCTPSLIAKLSSEDQVFCAAYNHFLQKLIETPFVSEPTLVDGQTVFHLGESHCLSYAHKKIQIHGIDHDVVPRITFGGKAYHFSTKKENAFKAITRANFHSLPEGSKVFLSFGEIDCRPNEGIISAASKLNRTIEDLVSDTTRGYVGWFAEQNHSKNHSLFFFNVPAPIYIDKYSEELNGKVTSTIKLFNSLLHKTVSDCGFNIIDVYKFTVGKDKFSNGLYHIDNGHLSSDAIPEIEKQIGTFV